MKEKETLSWARVMECQSSKLAPLVAHFGMGGLSRFLRVLMFQVYRYKAQCQGKANASALRPSC